jgi:hypothetical protein
MSRSFHQTVKKVLGGKSKSDIDEMVASGDDQVRALGKKRATKRKTRAARSAKRSEQR